MKCTTCGKRVHERFSRCPYCGSDLISHDAPAPAGPAPGQPAFTTVQPGHPAAPAAAPQTATAPVAAAPQAPPPAGNAAVPPAGAPPQGTTPAWQNAAPGFAAVNVTATPPQTGAGTATGAPVAEVQIGVSVAPPVPPENSPATAPTTSFAPVAQVTVTPAAAVVGAGAAAGEPAPDASGIPPSGVEFTNSRTLDAPPADAPEETVYKEVTVGPKSRPEKPEEAPKSEKTDAAPKKIEARPPSTAGYLWIFAGILLGLLYLNYFRTDLNTFLLSFSAQESFGEYVAANLSFLLDYTLLFVVHILAVITGVLLVLSGRNAIQHGGGMRVAKVCLVFQVIVFLNYLIRWIIYFATYYTNPSASDVLTIVYNLLLEILLIVQVCTAIRLQSRKQ